jgi:ribosomal-protein-alanine N-acetyltransferase
MPTVRRGDAGDLSAIEAIQKASPEAAQWSPAEYLQYDLLVAVRGLHVVAFVVVRTLAPGEREILNWAVTPEFRRQGIARALWSALQEGFHGATYLEVRASNLAAQKFYKSVGFEELTVRTGYYQNSSEPAIVMKFHSC